MQNTNEKEIKLHAQPEKIKKLLSLREENRKRQGNAEQKEPDPPNYPPGTTFLSSPSPHNEPSERKKEAHKKYLPINSDK